MASIVLSASRRTDIPAFYMPWFMSRIEKGNFEVINPYNQQVSQVPATADRVHAIVFWSKDFHVFLKGGYGEKLVEAGYHLFFNFTINSPHGVLEPGVPPLDHRLDQLTSLAERYGPQCIQWRFDPICYYQDASGQRGDNLDQFEVIAGHAAKVEVKVCITSFVDLYRKVERRVARLSKIRLTEPPINVKVDRIMYMAGHLSGLDMQLHLCCERTVLDALPVGTGVKGAACIPNRHLVDLYGPGISLRQDPGQRKSAGCGCGLSKDIGSYALHPCHHNCLFCYANPISDKRNDPATWPIRQIPADH